MEDARSIILNNVEQEVRHETAQMIKEIEQQAKEEADKKAREIVTLAINAALPTMSRKQLYLS